MSTANELYELRDDAEPADELLPLLDWLEQQNDFKERTVRRYLAEGRIPSAVRDTTGRWYLPAGRANVVPRELVLVAPPAQSDALARPWWALDDLSALLGLSVHNLRQMAAAGQLATTKGPHGRTIVWRGELSRLLGPGR